MSDRPAASIAPPNPPRPAVTIAMAVYNGGAQLDFAVRSILAQSHADWELVIVDDGSSDGAVETLLAEADTRIRVIVDRHNLGLAARLNQIIAIARAPLIARMDHDDIAHPERLRLQIAFLAANPTIDVVGSRCLVMSEAGRLCGQLPFAETHEDICRRPWMGFYLPHPSWMGRTEWFRRHFYAQPAPYACEDQELLLRAIATSRYHALPEPVLAYRVRERVPFNKLWRTRLALAAVQRQHFARHQQWGNAALSIGMLGARIASDLFRLLVPRARSDIRQVHAAHLAFWNDVPALRR